MSRRLQDCLALASYKNRHGFDRMSFSYVESQYHDQLRKRADGSSSVVSSESSSTSSSDYPSHTRQLQSSPLTNHLFSDDTYFQSGDHGPRKRARFEEQYLGPTPKASKGKSKKRSKSSINTMGRNWKTEFALPDSSPLANRFQQDFRTSHGPNVSFASGTPTIPTSPRFGLSLDDDEPRLPPTFHSSPPPSTPPPSLPRGLRNRKSLNTVNGEEGADLLLYLATSPSPARPRGNSRAFPPSTPPSKNAQLPSSMLNTPGNSYNLFSTPGQNFNFAEFCNVTPSPAQGAFGSLTPGVARTPLAAKEARRKLNFESPVLNGSPTMTRTGKRTGLGMELGGELGS